MESIASGPLFHVVKWQGPDRKRGHAFATRFPAYRRERGVTRNRLTFHSFRKCFVRALELAKIEGDRAAQVIAHECEFTFRVYNLAGIDMAALKEVMEAVKYPGLTLDHKE